MNLFTIALVLCIASFVLYFTLPYLTPPVDRTSRLGELLKWVFIVTLAFLFFGPFK